MSADLLVALIDYHNVRVRGSEESAYDCITNLAEIVRQVCALVRLHFPEAREVSLRLYGGWVDETGTQTHCATWIEQALSDIRGLVDGIRILPELVVSSACLPHVKLRGTIRLETGRRRQKMVDELMTLDALVLCQYGHRSVLICSGDDDLVPAALGARVLGSAKTCLARLGSSKPRPNDEILAGHGVTLAFLPGWEEKNAK
jgi:uncharacterized LabA/DUF88 family protein